MVTIDGYQRPTSIGVSRSTLGPEVERVQILGALERGVGKSAATDQRPAVG